MSKKFTVLNVGEIEYDERPFESECFKNKTIEIQDWKAENGKIRELFRQFEISETLEKGDLLFTRFDINDAKKSKEARDCGFYFMEASIEPFIVVQDWKSENFQNKIFKLEQVGAERIQEIMSIGESALTGLRFNRDDGIGEKLARERYRSWLQNAYEAGQDIVALIVDNVVVGFMLIKYDSNKSATWMLGGINPQFQGQGYGLKTYASVLAYCKEQGIEMIQTGISVGNVPVFNLYSKLGFKFKNPKAVMHYIIE